MCTSPSGIFFRRERTFHRCPRCGLIFTETLADKVREEAHYKKQWAETDPDFWKGQVDVLLQLILNYRPPEHILDFGSGSGAMTSELVRRGYRVTPVEPMIHGFLKDQNFSRDFDVVIAVEVIEHLPRLWPELRQIENVLQDGGIVVFATLMTNAFIDRADAVEQFADWWYKDDPTHVSFFCNRTLEILADLGGYDIDIFGNNLFVLQRTGDRRSEAASLSRKPETP